jgi:hypothetical protein
MEHILMNDKFTYLRKTLKMTIGLQLLTEALLIFQKPEEYFSFSIQQNMSARKNLRLKTNFKKGQNSQSTL